jgi:hypothetical protein
MGSNTTAAVIYSLDQFYALFVDPVIVVQFYRIGYPLTFLLGFFGNTASLFTFSRPTLRKVSTGCLFIVLAVSDMLYLMVCILDFLEFGLQVMKIWFYKTHLFCFNRFLSIIMLHTTDFVDFVHLSCMQLN